MARLPDVTVVWAFFYGSYMNLAVLRQVGVVPAVWHVARLVGFDIVIRPRANLVAAERGCVYGIVAAATHDELVRLYDHARDVLGEVYLPRAVLAETIDGAWRPALCYIAPSMEPLAAAAEYVDRIGAAARALAFPRWYIEHLESFRPTD
jgi:cation transport regulator ChaC